MQRARGEPRADVDLAGGVQVALEPDDRLLDARDGAAEPAFGTVAARELDGELVIEPARLGDRAARPHTRLRISSQPRWGSDVET